MAVDFNGSSSQNLNFGDAAAGVSSKLIMFWVYRDDTARGTVFFKGNTPWSQGRAGSFENASGIKFFSATGSTHSTGFGAVEGDRINILLARDPSVASDADGDAIVQFVAFTYG